ncbi:MAG: patatin-like phospholipase family protein [Taibaiella sp.]|nr:patatin-like phospholipase family protein [Taibaiella sp.]
MRQMLKRIYYFLPVQLVLLHFRKYQLLLGFWLLLVSIVLGHFASHFGASALFLAPEYLGKINFLSMMMLGGCMAVFVMGWHITTFIVHGHRIPYMSVARQSFLVYCHNNALIPLAFLIFYSIYTIHYQWAYEHATFGKALLLQLGFYIGFLLIIVLSFSYFFRVGRDIVKVVISKIANPSRIRDLIPYDMLDYEVDVIRADSFISVNFHIEQCAELEHYHPRVLNTVLRRQHRNAITATLVSYLVLLVLGIFMNEPLLRIPAGGSFLILFSIMIVIAGALKYFLKSWEVMGVVLIGIILSWMVFHRIFDLRSIAYGMDYTTTDKNEPKYVYDTLAKMFNAERYKQDKAQEETRLDLWQGRTGRQDPPLVVVMISGGGSRSAYWTMRTLQYADSLSQGLLFRNTVLISGASGGMIGAAYWREIHNQYQDKCIKDQYSDEYQQNIGKDLLNSIIFSFASVDLISPFNKISIAGYSYTKDRGYAMEQEMISNTHGMLDKKLGDYKTKEASGSIPMMVINNTITNDGRKLMICAQPICYLTRAEHTLEDTAEPPIDAVDFATFFAGQDPYNIRLTSALRMNAIFPYILPVVKLPSQPRMNVMDAGLRDNFGMEVVSRYLFVMRDWIARHNSNVIVLEIRDTRESEIQSQASQIDLTSMLSDPLFVIQEEWETFQSYYHEYIKDYLPATLGNKVHFIRMQYVPTEPQKSAALNFHLTQKEKEDISASVFYPGNQNNLDTLLKLLQQ